MQQETLNVTLLYSIRCRKELHFNLACIITADVFPLQGNMKQHMLTHKIRDMPSHLFETSKPPPPPVSTPNNDEGSNTEDIRTSSLESPLKSDLGMKRSPPEGEAVLPIPKRQPGMM
jgi:hypothetical protein